MKREQNKIAAHNAKTNVVQPNFYAGDLVLVRTAKTQGRKLSFCWIGPRIIREAINDVVYKLKDLIYGNEEQVHATRMVLYREDWRNKKVSQKLLEHAVHTEATFEVIDE